MAMFQNNAKKEQQVDELNDIINSTTTNNRGTVKANGNQKLTTLTMKEQVVFYDILRSMNIGKDGGGIMRVEMAMKQLEQLKENGISIDVIYTYLSNH